MAADCMIFSFGRISTLFSLSATQGLHFHRVISRVVPAIHQGLNGSTLHINHKQHYSSAPSPKLQTEVQQQIYSAVCIERLPVITPDKSELELRFEKLQDQLELEQSVLSDDELAVKKLSDRKRKLNERDEDESIEIAKLDAQRKEFQEEEEEEYRQFQVASRVTNEETDVQSMNRKLQHSLVLLLRRSGGSWEMPQGVIHDKETLRQAAQRRLQEACGSSLNVKFLSNAPAAVLKMSKIQPKCDDKVFFFKAHFLVGKVNVSEDYNDFAWLSRDELKDYLVPDYYKLIRRFLH